MIDLSLTGSASFAFERLDLEEFGLSYILFEQGISGNCRTSCHLQVKSDFGAEFMAVTSRSFGSWRSSKSTMFNSHFNKM